MSVRTGLATASPAHAPYSWPASGRSRIAPRASAPMNGKAAVIPPLRSATRNRQQGDQDQAGRLDDNPRRGGQMCGSCPRVRKRLINPAETVDRGFLRMVKDQVADRANALLHKFGALLEGGIDGRAVLPKLFARGHKRDDVKSGDGKRCDRGIDGIDRNQQDENESGDQQSAGGLYPLNDQVEYQQVYFFDCGQILAGIPLQMIGIVLGQQAALHFDRYFVTKPEREPLADQGQGQAEGRG